MFHTEFFCIVSGLSFFFVKYCAAAAGTAPKKIKPAASAGSRFARVHILPNGAGTLWYHISTILCRADVKEASKSSTSLFGCDAMNLCIGLDQRSVFEINFRILNRRRSSSALSSISRLLRTAQPSSLGRFNENVYVLNTASLQKSEVKKNSIQLLQSNFSHQLISNVPNEYCNWVWISSEQLLWVPRTRSSCRI